MSANHVIKEYIYENNNFEGELAEAVYSDKIRKILQNVANQVLVSNGNYTSSISNLFAQQYSFIKKVIATMIHKTILEIESEKAFYQTIDAFTKIDIENIIVNKIEEDFSKELLEIIMNVLDKFYIAIVNIKENIDIVLVEENCGNILEFKDIYRFFDLVNREIFVITVMPQKT